MATTSRQEAADEKISLERLTALAEESNELARIVAANPSTSVSLLRVLSRSEDEETRKNVALKPFAPYDVLSRLESQFSELFLNNPAFKSYNSLRP
jgi:TorA maturation chaperone TorD